MLQDDGSVEAYCTVHNHKQIMVNIPLLAKHILAIATEPQRQGDEIAIQIRTESDSTGAKGSKDPAKGSS